MIDLKPVDRDNLGQVVKLKTTEEQAEWLWANRYSLVEMIYEGYEGRAIVVDEQIVGLLIWFDETERHTRFLYHLMIDEAHQRKGYASAALHWLIEQTGAPLQQIEVSYHPDNTHARAFYEQLGFHETGINQKWNEMRAALNLR
jgi:diamine N-acetyltransferase